MRRVVGSVVLAAAIATPGIVVAATSAGRPSVTSVEYGAAIRPSPEPGPINPALRPAANAVKAALAAKGVELVVAPLGGQAAQAAELGPHKDCPVFIVFRLRGTSGLEAGSGFCSSRGAVEHGNIAISFVPASLGPTIEKALATLPGGSSG